MSDILIPPTEEGSRGGFDDFAGYDNLDLDGILAGLQENAVPFDEIPYHTPRQYGASLTTLASRKILPTPQSGTPLADFRNTIKAEVVAQGFPTTAGDDATVIASEFVGNTRLHGGEAEGETEGKEYTGECRLLLGRQPVSTTVMRVTTVLEAANYGEKTGSSEQERRRGKYEGGHGFEVIQAMAEEHGGTIGRYRVERDEQGKEEIVEDKNATRGAWVIWASFARHVTIV